MARTKPKRPPTHNNTKTNATIPEGVALIQASKNDTTTLSAAAAARRTSPRTSTSVRTEVAHERDNISTASGGTSGKSR
jgi:hypothetical protein